MVRRFQHRIVKKVLGYVVVTVPMITQLGAALIKPKYKGKRILRLQVLILSVRDGMANHRGKTIDPVEYGEMIMKRGLT